MYKGKDIIYRDLSVLELEYLGNIKNDVVRYEHAADLAITNSCLSDVPWNIKVQIGKNAMLHSAKYVEDKDLFELTVKEARAEISNGNSVLHLIGKILEAFPGQSITELQNLTHKDLIELGCLAEHRTQRQIFNVKGAPTKKKGARLVNPQGFPDDGKDLSEKMKELNEALGEIPR